MPIEKNEIFSYGKVIGEKNYYYRNKPDIYGKSRICLEELNNANSTIIVNNKEIKFPVLNIGDYYNGAKAYAFIEEFEKDDIAMVDVLYTSENIISKLENDNVFLNDFLSQFCRININSQTLNAPGLIMMPNSIEEQRKFVDAIKDSVQNSVNCGVYPLINCYIESEKEVIDERYDYKNAKQDDIVLEFIKDFYEIISRKKVRRPNDPRMKKVVNSLKKEATIIKSGCTIINDEIVGKYCFAYNGNVNNKKIIKLLTIYMAGVDDNIFSYEDKYKLEKFGSSIFESNILEKFKHINNKKEPISIFTGRYNEKVEKLETDKSLKKYFDEFNMLVKNERNNEGR